VEWSGVEWSGVVWSGVGWSGEVEDREIRMMLYTMLTCAAPILTTTEGVCHTAVVGG
jgi:hypothetical protein